MRLHWIICIDVDTLNQIIVSPRHRMFISMQYCMTIEEPRDNLINLVFSSKESCWNFYETYHTQYTLL